MGSLVNADGQVEDFIVEPQTNYAVGRFEKSIINKFSRIGIMGTDVREKILSASVVGWIGKWIDK